VSALARLAAAAVLVKAHVSGYDRKDGTHVDDYERGGPPKAKPQKVIGAQFGGKPWTPKPTPKAWHPQVDEHGKPMPIYEPHTPSSPEAWAHGDELAVVVPGGAVPAQLNGVPFAPWADAPTDEAAWEDVVGQADIEEPAFHCPKGLEPAAGLVLVEPDGRFVVVAPTNGFGGSPAVFPKGRTDGMPLQATAIKEVFEESGLQAEVTGFLGDFARTQTFTRFYIGRRVGGTPADCGWETQAVMFVPKDQLSQTLTGKANEGVLAACLSLTA
jgi:8-oxo-dGTP pyrophosphatase MutT (NUDIX family)